MFLETLRVAILNISLDIRLMFFLTNNKFIHVFVVAENSIEAYTSIIREMAVHGQMNRPL